MTDNLYLSQMIGEQGYEYIAKWLPLRSRKIEKLGEVEVAVYEPLVSDIVAIEKQNMDMVDFVFRNTTLEKEEIQHLPFSTFEHIKASILDFINRKQDTQTDTKKN